VPTASRFFRPMSMDLPDLLEPERIRCRCDIHSKKRALQTVAELLGEALRRATAADGQDPDDRSSASVGPGEGRPGAGHPGSGHPGSGLPGADSPESGADGAGVSGSGASSSRPARADSADGSSRNERKGARSGRGAKGERGAKKGTADNDDDVATVSDMDILDALISRERLGSTGLGHGVALPHSRLDIVDAPLAAMITLNEGVDFESGDGEPVDLVLGLLVPQDCNDEHLRILANLARRFNDAELRDALRGHDSGEELFEHLQRLAPAS